MLGSNSSPIKVDTSLLVGRHRICSKCGLPFDGNAIDIVLENLPFGEAYAWTTKVGVCILHKKFAERLGFPGKFKKFSVGSVCSRNGEDITDYLTFNTTCRPFVRGSKSPRLGPTCTQCNRFTSHTPQGGLLYILGNHEVDEEDVLLDQGPAPLVSTDIITKKELKDFKNIVIEDSDVRIFEHAVDGFADEDYAFVKL